MSEPKTDSLDALARHVEFLKADREAAKAKENAERWTRYVTLWIVLLAVATGITSQQQASFSGAAVRSLNSAAIEQGLASNQWAYYQSVSIKQHLYVFERERRGDAAGPASKAKQPSAFGDVVAQKLAKYDKQKKDISTESRRLEQRRDQEREESRSAQKHSRALALALTILQIAVALGSVAILAKKKWLFGASVAVGLLGILQGVNGVVGWLI